MKKLSLFLLVGVVALVVTPALAQNYPFEASAVSITASTSLPNGVFQRYWTTLKTPVNFNCSTTCPNPASCAANVFDGQNLCQLTWAAKGAGGYRGYQENIANYGSPAFGTIFNSLFDSQLNPGASNHIGYYAWVTGPVNDQAVDLWNNVNCTGTVAIACLGNANSGNSHALTGTPLGTIGVIGGMSPTPVPRSGPYSGGVFNLSWDAASSVGASSGAAVAGYDLYYCRIAPTGNSCPAAPSDVETRCLNGAVPGDWVFLRNVTTTTAAVGFAEVGMAAANAPWCVTFALRVDFPPPLGGAITRTRYLSANGQTYGTAQAVTVYDFKASLIKGTGRFGKNEITWSVSDESGVQRYEVNRGLSPNGPWTNVGTVTANGGPSYSFVDNTGVSQGQSMQFYYLLNVVDIDQAVTKVGPVKVSK